MCDEWIKDLEVGDKVYIQTSGVGRDILNLTTVIRVTPVGNIKTEDGSLFRSGVHKMDKWNYEFLKEWTQELEDKLKAKAHFNQLAHAINAIDARTLTPDQVQKIYDIVKENDEDV